MRSYYVYIMASRSRMLYTGVTHDLPRRVAQHKAGASIGFTGWYDVTRLVHVEEYPDIREAIAREKRIKSWTRARQVLLVQRKNPHWTDLARDWPTEPRRPSP